MNSSEYESHFITTSAAPLFSFRNSWCLEIGVQYALLMRANKPETAVQSSAPFSLGTTWIGTDIVQVYVIPLKKMSARNAGKV